LYPTKLFVIMTFLEGYRGLSTGLCPCYEECDGD
jgi:hypothetical protein